MKRWRGEPDPRHVKAVDAYFISAAEHGMNASTFTTRVVASTGADAAACISSGIGALSGPLHGGAPSRVLGMIEGVEKSGDAVGYVKGVLDRGERLMGFGHRVYRAEDRGPACRRTARELGAPRFEIAEELEKAALEELHARYPDRVLATNVEFCPRWCSTSPRYRAHVHVDVHLPGCGRLVATSLDRRSSSAWVRRRAIYVGPAPRKPDEVEGWSQIPHGD
jgi:citrate synthase